MGGRTPYASGEEEDIPGCNFVPTHLRGEINCLTWYGLQGTSECILRERRRTDLRTERRTDLRGERRTERRRLRERDFLLGIFIILYIKNTKKK
jgi:hypothetical protein